MFGHILWIFPQILLWNRYVSIYVIYIYMNGRYLQFQFLLSAILLLKRCAIQETAVSLNEFTTTVKSTEFRPKLGTSCRSITSSAWRAVKCWTQSKGWISGQEIKISSFVPEWVFFCWSLFAHIFARSSEYLMETRGKYCYIWSCKKAFSYMSSHVVIQQHLANGCGKCLGKLL